MKRYCGPCDAWVKGKECPKCGADTDKPLKAQATTRTDDDVSDDRRALLDEAGEMEMDEWR